MNTRKTVYNKLFTEKTELAKHEVELALVDDVKKAVNTYFSLTDTASSKSVAAISSLRVAIDLHTKAINESKILETLLAKINQNAKELGISPNQWEIYQDIQTALKDVQTMKQNLNLLQKSLTTLS